MDPDVGSIAGLILFGVFGAVIAFVVPKMLQKDISSPEDAEGAALPVLWLRILGGILLGVSFLLAIVLYAI